MTHTDPDPDPEDVGVVEGGDAACWLHEFPELLEEPSADDPPVSSGDGTDAGRT